MTITDVDTTLESLPPDPHPAWPDPLVEEVEPLHACPECQREFATKQALGSHRWGAHKVGSEQVKVKSKRMPPTGKVECPQCGKALARASLAKHTANFHPDTPNQGFEANDIFTTVVGLLYPDGQVPVDALDALIEWRKATEVLLDKVGTR